MKRDDLKRRNATHPVTMQVPGWMVEQIETAAEEHGETRERVLWGLLILGMAHSVTTDGLDVRVALAFADAKDRSENEQGRMLKAATVKRRRPLNDVLGD